MSRCPWCRTEGGELVELDGRMVCRPCEELIGGSVLLRFVSPFPETMEPEYDQYAAVSTEIQDPSSRSASYVSDEVWARLIVETCVPKTSEWSSEADRRDEPDQKKVDWLLTWEGRPVALEVTSKKLPDAEEWRVEGGLKIREPGVVGGSVHDPPFGLSEAIRRALSAKRKAGQFPHGYEKWVFVYVDALYLRVGGAKQAVWPQFENVFRPRHAAAQTAQAGHLETITRMVESFDFYDQVWLVRRGGPSHPWLVAWWVRDRGRHWDMIEVFHK